MLMSAKPALRSRCIATDIDQDASSGRLTNQGGELLDDWSLKVALSASVAYPGRDPLDDQGGPAIRKNLVTSAGQDLSMPTDRADHFRILSRNAASHRVGSGS